jgi:hypothetical protein
MQQVTLSMAEDNSHPTNSLETLEDISHVVEGNTSAPVNTAGDSGSPTDTTAPPNPTPVTPVAGEDAGVTGEPGFDYFAEKAKLLEQQQANPPPSAPAPAPQEQQVIETPPAPPEERLPAIKIRPADESSLQALSAFKEYQINGGNLNLIEWAAAQSAPAPGTPPAAPTSAPAPATEEHVEPVPLNEAPPEVLTPAQIRQEITRVGQELTEATRAFELDTMAQLQQRQTELMLALPEAMQREMQQQSAQQIQQQEAQTAFEREVAEYSQQAHQLYGDAVFDPNSALTQKAGEILGQMELKGDPIAFNPAASLIVYTAAAKALGIAPGVGVYTPPAPPVTQPVSPVPPVAPSSIIAGGDGRTQTASRAAMPAVTPQNYHEHKAAYLKTRGAA